MVGSDELRRWLERRGRGSASALARALGLTPTAIGEWSKGTRCPGREFQEALKIICGIPPESWDRPDTFVMPKDLEERARNYAAQLGAS